MPSDARLAKITDRLTPDLIALRKQLHQHPELAFEEHETAKAITAFLGKHKIAARTGIGKTGVIAMVEGAKPGPTIGIRADMDALPIHEQTGLPFASKVPGKMHACGHDVHTVIALGVAAALAEMRDSLHGKVKFIFQPAEETLSGARAMIADGALDEIRIYFPDPWHKKRHNKRRLVQPEFAELLVAQTRARRALAPRHRLAGLCRADVGRARRHTGPGQSRRAARHRAATGMAPADAFRDPRPEARPRRVGPPLRPLLTQHEG